MATNGMLTFNQFWSVYQAEWIVDLFVAKFYSLIQNNIGLNECIYYTHKLRMNTPQGPQTCILGNKHIRKLYEAHPEKLSLLSNDNYLNEYLRNTRRVASN